jgi:hypothetical protein
VRLREVKKYVEQIIARGGGFVPNWGEQLQHELGPFNGDAVFEPLFEGPRLVIVKMGIEMNPASPGASGVDIQLRSATPENVQSDVDNIVFSCPFSGDYRLSGIFAAGTSVVLHAIPTGDATDVTYLQPTLITEVPSL